MFRTIRSKLFFAFGVLGSATLLVGVSLSILFNNYVSANRNLLDKNFPQVIRASEFVATTNRLLNSGSTMLYAPNKTELKNAYQQVNKDLNAFRELTHHLSQDPNFKNKIRFIQLAQDLGNSLDLSLQLKVQIFELYNEMDTFFQQNNKHLQNLWSANAKSHNASTANKIRTVQAMLIKLTEIQGDRHRALSSATDTTKSIDSATKFQDELITATLEKQISKSTEPKGKLDTISSEYLNNYRKYLIAHENLIKKRSFIETSSNELRTIDNELKHLTSSYQEAVLSSFQKKRHELSRQVEQNSFIVFSVLGVSILFVALVIWLVSSRGIVARLNYLVDIILSGSKENIKINKGGDEIERLSDAIHILLTGQRHLEFSNKTMEVIARSKNLNGILKRLILFYEFEAPGSFCSVLLLDNAGKYFISGVAPSLPAFYNSAIEGLVIGPDTGSCGTAVYNNELTIVEDIETSPLWKKHKNVAESAGLKACWSQPIYSSKEQILGTFAVYYKTTRSPDEEELKLLKALAYKAGFAIESKYQEKALNQYTEELKQSNQELQNFAAIASHDLKEPLRKIITFGDLLIDTEHHISERSKNYLDRMQKASLRMANFIDDLLKYSKVSIDKDSTHPLNLKDVLTQVTSDLDTQITATKAQINISEMPTLNINFHQAQQLFQNFLSNALKFHKQDSPPIINITSIFNQSDKMWEIRVEDNGIGFEQKFAHRIFSMFERLQGRSAYEGTGIGLAICDKIVKTYGGNITTKSKLGEGATFIIHFPEALSSTTE